MGAASLFPRLITVRTVISVHDKVYKTQEICLRDTNKDSHGKEKNYVYRQNENLSLESRRSLFMI